MRVLVLDNELPRLREFRQRLIGHIVVCVTTAKDAIHELDSDNYDAAFLDHDLGDEINVPSGPGTGYEVAEWLEQHPDRQPKMIFIHSFSESGAKKMASILPKAVIAPGVWTKIKM